MPTTNLAIALPGHNSDGAEALTLEQLLRKHGPHAIGGEPETDGELTDRLDTFGRAIWRCPSRTQRELVRQVWIDYLREQTIPAVSHPWRVVDEAIRAGAPEQAALRSSWRWYSDDELRDLPPTVELVHGLLPESGLALLYGPTGEGKTHLALDIAQSVATGIAWHGHHVEQGPVAYILAEGIGGLAARVAAWKEARGWTERTGVLFLPQPVRMLEPVEVQRLITELGAWDPPPKLVEIDTLAWCLAGGDENSTRDMSAFVAAIAEIRETTAATVLVVHHTGHDRSRERGSTALAAAVDTVLRLKRDGELLRLTCEKQRDGIPFDPLAFQLVVSGPSVVPEFVFAHRGDGLNDTDRQALEALEAACVAGEWVSTTTWHLSSGLPHRTFHRCRKKLVEMALVEVEERGRYRYNRPALTENKRD